MCTQTLCITHWKPGGQATGGCGKSSRQQQQQPRSGEEGSSLPRTAGLSKAGSLERHERSPKPMVPLVRQMLHLGRCCENTCHSHAWLRPACWGPPAGNLWAKGLPACRCVIRRVQSCAQAFDSRDFSTAMRLSFFRSSGALLDTITRMRKIFLPKAETASVSFPACSAAPPGRILENTLSPSAPG